MFYYLTINILYLVYNIFLDIVIYMTPHFIPLGFHCNISFLSQDIHMKYETSLFEWLEISKLQFITDVIN